MGKNNIRRLASVLAAFGLLIAVANSCTYDYFVDETNFRLYVPQIERHEISHFYVSFHEVGGDHVHTRRVSAPFTGNEFIEKGILKFKLPPGNYNITTFAEYDHDIITEGRSFAESHKWARTGAGGRSDENTFVPGVTEPRALLLNNILIYPMGHPSSEIPVEADIDEDHEFKSWLICRFKDLPTNNITRVVVTYKGPSTRFDFDGAFRRFGDTDVYRHEFITAENRINDEVVCRSHVYPSTGELHTRGGAIASPTTCEQVSLRVDFYNGDKWSGGTTFTAADLAALEDSAKPIDEDGNILSDLILHPQKTISFLFEGFTLVGIALDPWGPIENGPIDMH